jgi:hypothetical protein
VSKINSTGTALLYSTYFSGGGDGQGGSCECIAGLAMDPNGNVYLTGHTSSEDFPTTPGSFQPTLTQDKDRNPKYYPTGSSAFLTKFNVDAMKALPVPVVTVTSSANSTLTGSSVTFTATVKPHSGKTSPTGTIGFDLDFYLWNPEPLDSAGKAVFTVPAELLPSGLHAMNAFYLGDANNAPASFLLSESIGLIPTTVTLTASKNHALYGTPITFTAKVSGNPPTPVPVGQVDVFDNTDDEWVFGSKLDSQGMAVYTSSDLPVGANNLSAQYAQLGDPFHSPSRTSLTVSILPLGTTPAPTITPGGGTYSSDQVASLADKMGGTVIVYTTDGSNPSASQTAIEYHGQPIYVDNSETIKAIATAPGYLTSPIAAATYVIKSF